MPRRTQERKCANIAGSAKIHPIGVVQIRIQRNTIYRKPLVQLPDSWHFLRFCHSDFLFESCFQSNPIGYSVAVFVVSTRVVMQGDIDELA
jgi:hypothetical protein